MPIAPNQSALKRRLDRYLWANKSGEMEALQAALKSNFRAFDRVAIMGGLVRDFAREGRTGFRSDVDLVIDDSKEKVELLAEKLSATPNRFGGYGYKSGPWKIDFWALETTWAKKHVPMQKLEDVLLGTFFDWDAVAYDLWERKLICHDDYLERIRAGTLEINLQPNPSPMGNLVRAIRRLVLWQVAPGEKLTRFIDDHLDERALRYLKQKEVELFPYCVSTYWKTAEEAKTFLFQERKLETLQLDLFQVKHRSSYLR
ncbi:hypothetical protein ACT4MW_24230 [Pseudomonas brassicacearum subsp. neoaurantiaca]|uniref:hypothetical protein n=1 Tax=Pseudomonas brassicacearum TaxID=930166 RepID=UPI004035FC58